MAIKKVSVMGLGAVGCTVAPQLISYLPEGDVRIIAGGARKERLQKQGIVVNDVPYACHVVAPEEEVEPADLVIVAVKYAALPQAVKDMKNHVGPNTIILSLMNGVDSREIIGAEYGLSKCIYGSCNISTVNLGNGHFRVAPKKDGILIGEAENIAPYSERIRDVAALFDAAGIGYKIPQSMLHDLWWKFLLNVGGNCTNTVLRGTQSYFQVLDSANQARKMIMQETLAVGQAEGVPISQADVDELMGVYVNYPAENTCSMLQDLLMRKPTENDMLCGYVIKLGKKHGIPTPCCEYLYYLIKALDEVNAGAPVVRIDEPMLY